MTVQTARPDEFYAIGRRRGGGGGRQRDVLPGREPGVGVQVPGGAVSATTAAPAPAEAPTPPAAAARDVDRPVPFLRAARAVFDLSLEGMVWTRRSLLMALLLALPAVLGRDLPPVRHASPSAHRRLRLLRRGHRVLLRAQRAAAGRAVLRDRAHRGRGGRQDDHLPAHAPGAAAGHTGREVRGLSGHHDLDGAAGGGGHLLPARAPSAAGRAWARACPTCSATWAWWC